MAESNRSMIGVEFRNEGYFLLPNLLADTTRSFLYDYARKLALTDRLACGDSQVVDAPSRYADPFMEALMVQLLPRIEAESGKKLFPTYTYFRLYRGSWRSQGAAAATG